MKYIIYVCIYIYTYYVETDVHPYVHKAYLLIGSSVYDPFMHVQTKYIADPMMRLWLL